MREPRLIGRDAAAGLTIALSVSQSSDLTRLGLHPLHCRLAVAELARAIFMAGGSVVYGGDLREDGYTTVLVDEARRYSERPKVLTICLAASVHRQLSRTVVKAKQRQLGNTGSIVCLDDDGQPRSVGAEPEGEAVESSTAAALTAMRRYVTVETDARVAIGGSLQGYSGAMPGVIEEVLLSLRARKPVYVAGGFGGAALAVCRSLGTEPAGWAPPDLPVGIDHATDYLDDIRTLARESSGHRVDDGLNGLEREQLAATHRAGDIASLVIRGLSGLH